MNTSKQLNDFLYSQVRYFISTKIKKSLKAKIIQEDSDRNHLRVNEQYLVNQIYSILISNTKFKDSVENNFIDKTTVRIILNKCYKIKALKLALAIFASDDNDTFKAHIFNKYNKSSIQDYIKSSEAIAKSYRYFSKKPKSIKNPFIVSNNETSYEFYSISDVIRFFKENEIIVGQKTIYRRIKDNASIGDWTVSKILKVKESHIETVTEKVIEPTPEVEELVVPTPEATIDDIEARLKKLKSETPINKPEVLQFKRNNVQNEQNDLISNFLSSTGKRQWRVM